MKKYTQDFNTLRLRVAYSQFADSYDTIFAFNVLKDKGYEKSSYITKAIKYYDETRNDSIEIAEAFFPIRCMKFIKDYYGIKSKKDLRNLLALGFDSDTFKNAENRMLKHEVPRVSLLGFNKSNPESVKMHDRLFQLDVRERITLISTAIKKYVMDGQDSAAMMSCSYKLIHDAMIDYEKAENKELIVKTFYDLMQQSKYLENKDLID